MPSRLASNFVLVCCPILLLSMPAQPQAITTNPYQRQIASRLPAGTKWGLQVFDYTGDKMIALGAKDETFVPGSSLKLMITGAEMSNSLVTWPSAALLSETTPRAEVLAGNLYLRGFGNAMLSVSELKRTVDELHRQGLRRIDGNVIADETFCQVKKWHPVLNGPAYPPPGALGLDLHTVRIIVRPAQAGEAPLVSIEPANDSVHFAVAARTGDGASNSLQITQLDDRSYKITGHLPVGAAETVRRFALADPALYAAEVLKSLLEKAGIIVRGTVRKGKTSEGAEVLAEIPGPPLAEVLRDMNHHSLNVVADNLLLSLGANRFGLPGTRENGVEAVEEFLEGLGLPMNEVTIYDGSGLSDRNRVTANFMARYLVAVTKKPWFEEFRNSLPRPGYEGTLKEIGFKDERFRVKSGRLENVYALAGYGVNGSGKDVAFSFMVNGPGIGILPYMDEIGAEALRFIANESFQ